MGDVIKLPSVSLGAAGSPCPYCMDRGIKLVKRAASNDTQIDWSAVPVSRTPCHCPAGADFRRVWPTGS